ncbi:MAG: VWA domain-containing protein [Kiritimatiellia bacterium]|nr:VWA domain-containing protein [Lentisphaerota bacterium]
MFEFQNPVWFILLLPWLAVVWAVYARRRSTGMLFTLPPGLPPPRRTWRLRLRTILPAAYLAGALLLICALARPQLVFARVTRTTDALAIQLVVDISGSMEALDFSTGRELRSRMDVVKDTMAEFVAGRPDDLLGLVAFGGFAVSRVPLTLDHSALQHVLAEVQVPRPQYDRQGRIVNEEDMLTAIGDALAVAAARLEQEDVKSRVIVLISDGESNTGVVLPEVAMRAVKALGIKIYTIGVGSTGPAPFRARDIFGREVIQRAQVTMDEELLQRLADETDGVYYNVRDPKGLERAFSEIDRLERTEVHSDIYRRHNELYARWLWPGLVMLCLALVGNMIWGRRLI